MFRIKWADISDLDMDARLKQDKLMIRVRQRLKADKMVLSYTDEHGFQCYVKAEGKRKRESRDRCVLCGHTLREEK